MIRKNWSLASAVHMIKSVLILMLAATQLLAGSGGVYLCIRNDGSFCCLDAGPQTCTCCEDKDTDGHNLPTMIAQEASACGCGCSDSGSSGTRDEDRESRSAELAVVALSDPCGCTHIRLSQDQTSIRVARTASAIDSDVYAPMVADPSSFTKADGGDGARFTVRGRSTPPPMRSHALTVLSWISIQC